MNNSLITCGLAVWLSGPACFSPTFPEGVLCAEGRRCPGEQVCAADNRCYSSGHQPPIDSGVVDSANVSSDAPTSCEDQIVFASVDDLWLIDPDGSGLTNLTQGSVPGPGLQARWSPDAKSLAYISDDQLWAMDRDGGNRTQLAVGGFRVALSENPWTQDSQSIVFSSFIDNSVYRADVSATDPTRLADGRLPVWSFDETRVLFDFFDNQGNLTIRSVGRFGGNSSTIVDGYVPLTSPTEAVIAFLTPPSNQSPEPGEIGVVPDDGSSPAVNITNSLGTEESKRWSTDGSKLVFSRSGDIYTMNNDGSAQTRLSTSSALDFRPSFSPRGSEILFLRAAAANVSYIYLMDLDGNNQRRLTGGIESETFPQWSPCR